MLTIKNNKIKLKIFIFLFVLSLFLFNAVLAYTQYDRFVSRSGFSTTENVGSIMAAVIQGFLSILGIIFVILIIYAGFNWMTASGDEQKVTKAKDTITKAVIGLVIIVAAYSITYFVFNAIPLGSGAVDTSSSSGSGGGWSFSEWWSSWSFSDIWTETTFEEVPSGLQQCMNDPNCF